MTDNDTKNYSVSNTIIEFFLLGIKSSQLKSIFPIAAYKSDEVDKISEGIEFLDKRRKKVICRSYFTPINQECLLENDILEYMEKKLFIVQDEDSRILLNGVIRARDYVSKNPVIELYEGLSLIDTIPKENKNIFSIPCYDNEDHKNFIILGVKDPYSENVNPLFAYRQDEVDRLVKDVEELRNRQKRMYITDFIEIDREQLFNEDLLNLNKLFVIENNKERRLYDLVISARKFIYYNEDNNLRIYESSNSIENILKS